MYKSLVDKPRWRLALFKQTRAPLSPQQVQKLQIRLKHGGNATTALQGKSFNPKNVRKKIIIPFNCKFTVI